MGRINAMKAFLERNGIFKGWLCEGVAMPRHAFDYRLEIGFTDDEILKLEDFLHRKGTELLKFKFSDDNVADLDRLKNNFGISIAHLASYFELETTGIKHRAAKINGFDQESELEILDMAIKSIAHNMINFSLPMSLKKAA